MKNKLIKIISGVLLSIGIYFMGASIGIQDKLGGISPAMSRFNSVATSSVMTVTSDVMILATSTRSHAIICNDGGNKVYLGINSDKPITNDGSLVYNAGIAIAANTCYEFNNDNLYAGSIRASSTISSDLLITEVKTAY